MEGRQEPNICTECRGVFVEMLAKKKANLIGEANEINQRRPERWATSDEHAQYLGSIASALGKLELLQELTTELQNNTPTAN